jgi:hypothetical protein
MNLWHKVLLEILKVADPCGSCKNSCFKGIYRHHQGENNQRARNISILVIEAISSSETSVL